MAPRKIILNITPQTHVRVTAGDKVFFRIARKNLRPSGLKRLLRIERYNNYKVSVCALAKEQQFTMPAQGCRIYFYLPLPQSWSQKKKTQYHFSIHQRQPDIDNLTKALMDGLMVEDKHIAHLQVAKFWVDFPTGWIEIYIDEPVFPQHAIPSVKGRSVSE